MGKEGDWVLSGFVLCTAMVYTLGNLLRLTANSLFSTKQVGRARLYRFQISWRHKREIMYYQSLTDTNHLAIYCFSKYIVGSCSHKIEIRNLAL